VAQRISLCFNQKDLYLKKALLQRLHCTMSVLKSSLRHLDAYAKTLDDFRVRTNTGGIGEFFFLGLLGYQLDKVHRKMFTNDLLKFLNSVSLRGIFCQ
jgi:hypothetical protein